MDRYNGAVPSTEPTPLRTACLALVLLLLTGCRDSEAPRDTQIGDGVAADAGRAEPAPVIPAEAPTVVFLGDSIAAGLHLPADSAFPAVLQRLLVAEDLPFHLVNAGISGGTTAGGVSRLDWVLRSAPDIVVVELGANDGLRGQTLESIEGNLRTILERCKEAGARTLLLGMRLPTSYGADYADGFADLYERVAEETGTAFLPFFMEGVAGNLRLNLPDGIHPTAEGHRALAKNVLPELRRLLMR